MNPFSLFCAAYSKKAPFGALSCLIAKKRLSALFCVALAGGQETAE
jgi:hypothetical protein